MNARVSGTKKGPALAAAAAALALAGAQGSGAAPETHRFRAHHAATVRDIPAGAKQARIWLVVPREDPAQEVGRIELDASVPATRSVRAGGTCDNRYACFEVENPPATVQVAAKFDLVRRAVDVRADPAAAQPLAAADRRRFRAELEASRFVPVGGKYEELARTIVGEERNTVRQARMIYDWVLNHVEYWVKDPQRLKASANGESDYCLATRTGNCTDFHSLYTSLARSIGIPTRMVYGSFFQGENTPVPGKASLEAKDTDAGYHCWVEVYAKGIGWIPLDVARADLLPTKEAQQRYFGYLEPRRVTWTYGRDLTLAPRQAAGPVNAMPKVYVEIDGQPHPSWDRKFTYGVAR